MAKLLVVDDEPNILFTIKSTLESEKLEVLTAETAKEGLESFRRSMPDVVLLDVRLPDQSGLELFQKIHALDAKVPVIVMTAFSRTDTAIEAIRNGAFDYLVKPVALKELRSLVNQAVEISILSRKRIVLDDLSEETEFHADYIVGHSPAMQNIYKAIGRLASQEVTVLIQGESGTGKELIARAIYHYSQRSQKPFLAVNCAALSESLLESELFGHEKGAFTGAEARRIGKFEQVNGGTIFLDEIGDMSLATQAKSLRLLQQQQFQRVGGNETIQTDVRIIAATNRDLRSMVTEGTFREDLFYRLSGFTIDVPPLRSRTSDIQPIVEYLLKVFAKKHERSPVRCSPEVVALLEAYPWPGNVRELANAVQYALVNTVGDLITVNALPSQLQNPQEKSPSMLPFTDLSLAVQAMLDQGESDIYRQVISKVERVLIDAALEHTSGNQVAAAERLGISRMTLRAKIKEAGSANNESTE